jgi:hypothetical protein
MPHRRRMGRPCRQLPHYLWYSPGTLRYSRVLYGTLRYSTVLYGTLRYSTVLRVLHGTLRYSTVLYGTAGTLRYYYLEQRLVRDHVGLDPPLRHVVVEPQRALGLHGTYGTYAERAASRACAHVYTYRYGAVCVWLRASPQIAIISYCINRFRRSQRLPGLPRE